MPKPDSEFDEFAATFAGPLTALSFLLADGLQLDPRAMTIEALAAVERRWRDGAMSEDPESLAIEAMARGLPRGRGGSTARNAAVAPISPAAGVDAKVDLEKVHAALWQTWRTLAARERVPLVFTDPSVISPRLATAEIPSGVISRRRMNLLAQQGLLHLQDALSREKWARDIDLVAELGRTLAEHAPDACEWVPATGDAWHAIRRRRLRTRAGAAMVVAALVGVVVAGVTLSRTPASRHEAGSRESAAPTSILAVPIRPVAPPAAGTPTLGGDQSPGGLSPAALTWRTRGNLRGDSVLAASIVRSFLARHGDVVSGPPHVAVLGETPELRIALVIATTPLGALESWFYGGPGATALREGAVRFEAFGVRPAIVDVLADGSGHGVLVAVGPPTGASIQVGDRDFGGTASSGDADGVAMLDVTGNPAAATDVRVTAGTTLAWSGRAPSSPLAPTSTMSDDAVMLDATMVDRGNPDPAVAHQAIATALRAVPLAAMAGPPVVLWGGVDDAGNHAVVMRARGRAGTDALIVAWSRYPDGAVAYPISSNAPDFPQAFAYGDTGARRLGALPPATQVTRVGFVVDGVDLGIEDVTPQGFASVPIDDRVPAFSGQRVQVTLLNSYELLGSVSLPQPPRMTAAGAMRDAPSA